MVKVKCGAIIKNVSEGALKWYTMAGYKVIEEKKREKKSDKTNSKETIAS